jgi:hypothetical protein
MGQPADITEDFDCSDKRILFRLLLAEIRRQRKLIHSISVTLAEAKDDCRTVALDKIMEAK